MTEYSHGNSIYAFAYNESLDMVCLSIDYYGVTYDIFMIDAFFFVSL